MAELVHPETGKSLLGPSGEAIAVYTQGKVGSKSLVEALEGMYTDTHIWDIRRGLMEGVIEHETIRGTRPNLLSEDRQFAEFLIQNPETDIKAVSVVREPVAIALSSLFYNFIPRNPGVNINNVTDQEFIDRLVKGESFSSPSFHLDWFDIEVKPLTGINVYEEGDFPKDRGYTDYEGSNKDRMTKLLMMRLENIKEIAYIALTEFFGIQAPDELPRNNVGATTEYGARYNSFKESVQLPEDWVQWQLSSQFAQHFYTAEELERFADRWVTGF